MPDHATQADYKELSQQFSNLAIMARERIAARDAEIAKLKRDNASLTSDLAEAKSLVSQRFAERQDGDDAPGLGIGQSPMSDLSGWRASQLGGMSAPISGYVIRTPPDNR
jgi:hypothetical protein